MFEYPKKFTNYQLDRILTLFKIQIKSMISAQIAENPNMREKDFEYTKWRWDLPELMVRWYKNHIGRNIVITISEYDINIECNAWQDIDTMDSKKENRLRKWSHKKIARLSLNEIYENYNIRDFNELYDRLSEENNNGFFLYQYLYKAYDIVDNWIERDLNNKTDIKIY
ncbi:MAG: hypothetical protein ACFFBP_21090 [Promethearchaeota archaeon]